MEIFIELSYDGNWENQIDINSSLDMPTLRERSDIREIEEKEG